MKIGTLIIAFLALAVLVGSPFSFRMADGSPSQGPLVCYCCLAKGIHCHCCSLACPKTDTAEGIENFDWCPDIILPSFDLSLHFNLSSRTGERTGPPENIYGQVPVKPPNIPESV
jgi:hypothetical protein